MTRSRSAIHHLRLLFLFLVLVATACGAEIKIGSINCYLLFDPSIDHRGSVDNKNKMTVTQYESKIHNLATLTKDYQIIALEEVGGKQEAMALAQATSSSWAWTKGRDSATGEDVAILYHLPDWNVTSKGRVKALDKVVSKHLLILASKGNDRVYVLAVHLLRPIGAQEKKQAMQREAIGAWMKSVHASEPTATIVVLGDTNTSERVSLYGVGIEAGLLNGFSPTHLNGRCYDRLVVFGKGQWRSAEIRKPPYGKRPNNTNKRVWTDHYFIGATLDTDS